VGPFQSYVWTIFVIVGSRPKNFGRGFWADQLNGLLPEAVFCASGEISAHFCHGKVVKFQPVAMP